MLHLFLLGTQLRGVILPDLETHKLGSERGTQLPKVTQLFRDKEGIQIQSIRLQTPFLCKTLGQKRRGQTGFMGYPDTTFSMDGGAKSSLRPEARWDPQEFSIHALRFHTRVFSESCPGFIPSF